MENYKYLREAYNIINPQFIHLSTKRRGTSVRALLVHRRCHFPLILVGVVALHRRHARTTVVTAQGVD